MYTHKNTKYSKTPTQNPVSGENRLSPQQIEDLARRWDFALQEWRLQAMEWLTLLCPPDPDQALSEDFLDCCQTVAYLDQIRTILLASRGEKRRQILEVLEADRTIDEMEAVNREGWEILLEEMKP